MALDVISKGAEWLRDKQLHYVSRAVQVVIAGGPTIAVDATRDRTVFDVVQDNSTIRVETADWIISASDLPAEPKRGDRVVEVAGGVTYTYEVMSLLGIPPWSWCDATRTGYRLHCKLIEDGGLP